MSSSDDSRSHGEMIRMGYWISEKKSRKLNIEDFTAFCRNAGVQLVKLDLEKPLDDQGPFDLIFHKLTDILAKANVGNERACTQIHNFERYIRAHPEVAVVDPLDNIQKLMDRHVQYLFVTECEPVERSYQYFTPSFVEFTSKDVQTNKDLMERLGVQFPFICKPSVAHGSSHCHQMAIIFNEAGLRDVEPPCVAQTFINHNAVLYKIFIIGKQHFVVPRPSIKNFAAGDHKTIHFDSAVVSKPYSCTFLNVLDEEDVSSSQQMAPDPGCLEHLSRRIQDRLGLDLIGVDVIIENHTGRYAVIDINAFPGYENGIDDLYTRLLNVFLDKLQQQTSVSSRSPPPAVERPLTSARDTSAPPLSGSTEAPDTTSSKSSHFRGDGDDDTRVLSTSVDTPPITDNNNCNVDDQQRKHKAKDCDKVMVCNQRNFPVSMTTCTHQKADPSIWDQLVTNDANSLCSEGL